MIDIANLVNQYPNDMELGAKVRELYFENKKMIEEIFEQQDGKFIYESPDGGKTVYQRPIGGDINNRTLVK
jgi:hypothetical protein